MILASGIWELGRGAQFWRREDWFYGRKPCCGLCNEVLAYVFGIRKQCKRIRISLHPYPVPGSIRLERTGRHAWKVDGQTYTSPTDDSQEGLLAWAPDRREYNVVVEELEDYDPSE